MTSIQTKKFALNPSQFFRILVLLHVRSRWWLHLGILVLALLSLSIRPFNALVLVVAAVCVFLVYVVPRHRSAFSKENAAFYLTSQLTIDQDWLHESTDDGSRSDLPWTSIIRARMLSEFYLLYTAKNQFICLPSDAFASDEDRQQFESLLFSHGLMADHVPAA
jgi:hypothetical protein